MVEMLSMEMQATIAFGISYIIMGIIAVAMVLQIYKIMKKREEVSMVSFLLNPKETVTDIKIAFYACLIIFIGFLFSVPYTYTYFNQSSLIYYYLILFPITGSGIFAFLMTIIAFRWLKRFRKYG